MKYTNIFEKLVCIFDVVSDSWLYIAFLGIVTLLLILLACKKISKRSCFLICTLACFILFGYTLCWYFKPISKMMNSLVEHLFTEIYFPSAYAYLFVLVVVDVVAIGSLLNPRGEKVYKTIHGIGFVMMNFILTIILEMVAKNKIDIFSKESLFSNTDFIILLEFSMNIFILWCISILAVYVINIVTERIVIYKENYALENALVETSNLEVSISNSKLEEEYLNDNDVALEESVIDTNVSFIEDDIKNEVVDLVSNIEPILNETVNKPLVEEVVNETENYFIPSFINQEVEFKNDKNTYIEEVASKVSSALEKPFITLDLEDDNVNNYQDNNVSLEFDLSAFIPKKQEIKPIQNFNSTYVNANNMYTTTSTTEIFDKILKNELPVAQEIDANTIKEEEAIKDSYTLNDYRIFHKMLKDIREHNQSNSVSIDKMLEYRLITKYSTETYDMFKKMLKIYSN